MDALLTSLDYHQILEWVAFFQLESKHGKKEFTPEDFEIVAAKTYG